MSRSFVVEKHVGPLRLIASPNGTASYPVYVYRDGSGVPVGGDTVNLSRAKAREEFMTAHVPEEYRPVVLPVLLDLAQSIDAERVKMSTKDGGSTTPKAFEDAWPEPVDGAELVEAIVAKLRRYVVLPQDGAFDVIALWTIHTYVTDVTDYTPYILVTSPVRECGKSTLLELLLWLAFAARLTGGITAAALYRIIARGSVTTLLDELDTRLRGDGGEALRGVLNTGFHRSGKITICVGDDHEERDFPTYCPKVLAGIGHVWDTVASRSIPIRMERASKADLARLARIRGDRIGDECAPLRRMARRWGEDHRDALREADPETPEALGARQSDVCRPLLAIADEIGGEWPLRARRAAVALLASLDDEGDFALLLLKDLYALLGDREVIYSAELLNALGDMDDRPWSEYGHHQRPITARGVAKLLGRFGVKPHTVRFGSETKKGYSRRDLAPAFVRYIPELSVTSVTLPRGDASPAPIGSDVTLVTDTRAGVGAAHLDEQSADDDNFGALLARSVVTSDDSVTPLGLDIITDGQGNQRLTPEGIERARQQRAARRATRGDAA